MAGILHASKDGSSESITEMHRQTWLMQLRRARLLAALRNGLSDKKHAPSPAAASQSCAFSDTKTKRFPSSNLGVHPQSKIHKPPNASSHFGCSSVLQNPSLINPRFVQCQANHGRVPMRPVYIVMNYLQCAAAADTKEVGNGLQRHDPDEERNEFLAAKSTHDHLKSEGVAPVIKKKEFSDNSDVDLTLKL